MSNSVKAILLAPVLVALFACQSINRYELAEEQANLHRMEDREAIYQLVGSEKTTQEPLISALYAKRNYEPVWDKAYSMELIELLADEYPYELEENGYKLEMLQELIDQKSRLPSHQKAEADVFFTTIFLEAIHRQFVGRVSPDKLGFNWRTSYSSSPGKLLSIAEAAIASGSIAETVQRYAPSGYLFSRLKKALNHYRLIGQNGGWSPVPFGATLKLGSLDARVPAIRRRLQVTGDLDESKSSDIYRYDIDLAEAVRHFQHRHGIKVDGVVGRKTQAAMNRMVDERIDQIRLNLERARWLFVEKEKELLLINIADFRAYLVRDGKKVWQARTQVGTPYRKSPIFKAKMKYLVLNPTWTVPPTILKKDILPRLQAGELDYLQSRNIRVLDFQGNRIDAASIDWSAFKTRLPPYLLRQDAGAGNALGRIKFVFPNNQSIFLHDTPSKSLFDKPTRAFSSGCIRIERPFELAQLVLGKKNGWNLLRMREVIELGETKTIFLPRQLPVLLAYWTVEVDDEGQVRFINDIYDRDQAVLNILNRKLPKLAKKNDWLGQISLKK